MTRTLLALSVLLASAALAAAVAQEDPGTIVEAPDVGIRWTIPDVGWESVVKRGADGLEEVKVGPKAAGGLTRLSLKVSGQKDSSLAGVKAHVQKLRDAVAGDASIRTVEDLELEVAGRRALGLEVFQDAYEREFKVHLVFLRDRGFQYRIQFHAPKEGFDELWASAQRVLEGLEFVAIEGPAVERARLGALAARCGSQVDWAPNWEAAQRRATRQKRPIVVSVYALPGFQLGNRLDEGVFMSREVLDLVEHRFVAVRWKFGEEAPFVDPQVFGLSRSTFGVGLLVCSPSGRVLRQVFDVDATLVADALRETLVEHPELAPPPKEEKAWSRAARVAFLLDSGQLEKAGEVLLALRGDSIELLEQRLRLHLLERDATAAERVLTEAREAEGAAEEAAAARLDLAEATLRMGSRRVEEAAEPLARCVKDAQDEETIAQARLYQGVLAYAGGRREQARDVWTALTLDLPEQPDAWAAAAILLGPALEVDLRPDVGWPSASRRRMARLPPAAPPGERLDLDAALGDATTWLLETQRPDGSWDTPTGNRDTHPAPPAIHLAAQAICVRAVARMATVWREDHPERARRCRAAALVGLRRYLAGCERTRVDPRPVAFMDYTAWHAAYGLFGLLEVLDANGTVGATLPADLRSAVELEARHLVGELARVQAPNGGWSYYLSGRVDGPASDTAMSFTTATVLLALDRARARGFAPPEDVLERGHASLERLRGTNGMFEYMRQGPSRHAAGLVAPEGSAGRGPVCTLALQRAGRLDDRAMKTVLVRYARHLGGFGDQSRKALMHAGPHGQGSHYLLYDYSSAAEAMRLSDAAIVGGDVRQVVRAAILRELARCRSADGSFVDNPLIGAAPATGMAVLTLADLREGLPPR